MGITRYSADNSKRDIERRFHDAKACSNSSPDPRNFYSAGGLDRVWRVYLSSAGDLRGKKVLDFGCGEGWSTVEYAKRGAKVYAFDLSPESVRNLVWEAKEAGVAGAIHPVIMAAEELGYPDGIFDLVLGVSILHHTELHPVGREIMRVLKSGGRALFIEPLAHNPLLRVFRWLTPGRRTPTEQPMTIKQIGEFGRAFRTLRYEGFYLLSIFPQGLYWLTGKQWLFRRSLWLAESIDRWLLRVCPLLKRYCWTVVIEVRK